MNGYDWAYDNLERDSVAGAAEHNIAKHGAETIRRILGQLTWSDNYGQSPFDRTFSVAYRMTGGTAWQDTQNTTPVRECGE